MAATTAFVSFRSHMFIRSLYQASLLTRLKKVSLSKLIFHFIHYHNILFSKIWLVASGVMSWVEQWRAAFLLNKYYVPSNHFQMCHGRQHLRNEFCRLSHGLVFELFFGFTGNIFSGHKTYLKSNQSAAADCPRRHATGRVHKTAQLTTLGGLGPCPCADH